MTENLSSNSQLSRLSSLENRFMKVLLHPFKFYASLGLQHLPHWAQSPADQFLPSNHSTLTSLESLFLWDLFKIQLRIVIFYCSAYVILTKKNKSVQDILRPIIQLTVHLIIEHLTKLYCVHFKTVLENKNHQKNPLTFIYTWNICLVQHGNNKIIMIFLDNCCRLLTWTIWSQ